MTEVSERKRGFVLTRRKMIWGGGLVGGALAVGYAAAHPIQVIGGILQGGGADPEYSAFGSFIRIEPDQPYRIWRLTPGGFA